jgi:predicted nucleic acid-binding protein
LTPCAAADCDRYRYHGLDRFFGAKETPFDLHLTHLIEQGESLGLTDLVYCEVLQGIRDETDFVRVRDILQSYPILRMRGLNLFEEAAGIYRDCRRRGLTIRKTIDCLYCGHLLGERCRASS